MQGPRVAHRVALARGVGIALAVAWLLVAARPGAVAAAPTPAWAASRGVARAGQVARPWVRLRAVAPRRPPAGGGPISLALVAVNHSAGPVRLWLRAGAGSAAEPVAAVVVLPQGVSRAAVRVRLRPLRRGASATVRLRLGVFAGVHVRTTPPALTWELTEYARGPAPWRGLIAATTVAALLLLALGYGGYLWRAAPAWAGGSLLVDDPEGQRVAVLPLPPRAVVVVGQSRCRGAHVRLAAQPGGQVLFRLLAEGDVGGGAWCRGMRAWRHAPVLAHFAEAAWPYHLYPGTVPQRRVDLSACTVFGAAGLTFTFRRRGQHRPGAAAWPGMDLLRGWGEGGRPHGGRARSGGGPQGAVVALAEAWVAGGEAAAAGATAAAGAALRSGAGAGIGGVAGIGADRGAVAMEVTGSAEPGVGAGADGVVGQGWAAAAGEAGAGAPGLEAGAGSRGLAFEGGGPELAGPLPGGCGPGVVLQAEAPLPPWHSRAGRRMARRGRHGARRGRMRLGGAVRRGGQRAAAWAGRHWHRGAAWWEGRRVAWARPRPRAAALATEGAGAGAGVGGGRGGGGGGARTAAVAGGGVAAGRWLARGRPWAAAARAAVGVEGHPSPGGVAPRGRSGGVEGRAVVAGPGGVRGGGVASRGEGCGPARPALAAGSPPGCPPVVGAGAESVAGEPEPSGRDVLRELL